MGQKQGSYQHTIYSIKQQHIFTICVLRWFPFMQYFISPRVALRAHSTCVHFILFLLPIPPCEPFISNALFLLSLSLSHSHSLFVSPGIQVVRLSPEKSHLNWMWFSLFLSFAALSSFITPVLMLYLFLTVVMRASSTVHSFFLAVWFIVMCIRNGGKGVNLTNNANNKCSSWNLCCFQSAKNWSASLKIVVAHCRILVFTSN